jgi:hypothetical protein
MTKRLLSIEKRAVLSGWILGALLVLALGAAYQFGNTALVEGIRGHIASYRLGQPIRDVR